MNIKHRVLLYFILLLFNSSFSQNNGPAVLQDSFGKFMQKNNTVMDSLVTWQEQVVLHTDKDQVNAKDHLFFKAYLLTGPKQLRVSASNVLKVELLDADGNLIDDQYHKIQNGTAYGAFKMPKRMKPGKHYLRAYTRWMLNYGPENFAIKQIDVKDKKSGVQGNDLKMNQIQFYPEGGQIVTGIENRVAVTIKNSYKYQIPIVEDNGEVAAYIKNYGNGIATFLLTPEAGKNYSLVLSENQKVRLPELSEVGYSLQVNNIAKEKIVVRVGCSESLQKQKIYLKGKVNENTIFQTNVNFDDNYSVEIDVSKNNLPNGILQLMLEDEFGQVWAQRPIHINNKQLQLSLKRIQNEENDAIELKVTDENGDPIATNLSLSVKSIQDPRELEKLQSNRNQRFLNDLMVLTNQLPQEYALDKAMKLPSEIKYNFQKGLDFYGRAYDLDAVPLINTNIQVVINGQGQASAYEVVTDEQGLFRLSDLQVNGKVDMVFRRSAEGQRDKFVEVIPYDYKTPPLVLGAKGVIGSKDNGAEQSDPVQVVNQFNSNENIERLVTLEGVTLTGQKLQIKRKPSVYGIEPKNVVYQNPERPKTLSQLLLGIPGFNVVGIGDLNPDVQILNTMGLGMGPILWVVDGFPLDQPTSLVQVMNIVSHVDIDRIEVLNGSEASIYGTRAAGGVILIYRRDGGEASYFNRKKAQLTFEGYSNPLTFEAYRNQSKGKKKKIDNGLLYWNPSVTTNENGKVLIELPKEVLNQKIEIDIKSITEDGKKGSLRTVVY